MKNQKNCLLGGGIFPPIHLKVVTGLMISLLAVVAIWIAPLAQADTSTSYQLDSEIKHAESSTSTSFVLCSQISESRRMSESTSYQLMPAIDCEELVVAPPTGGGGRRRPPTGQSAVCGNGIPEVGEQCDDGNIINGDGCTVECTLEPDITPPGPGPGPLPEPTDPGVPGPGPLLPSGPSVACGNGIVEYLESCDDGNLVDGDGCSQYCRRELGEIPEDPETPEQPEEPQLPEPETPVPDRPAAPEVPEEPRDVAPRDILDLLPGSLFGACGDGRLDFGEVCDDGNLLDGDGCSRRCQREDLFGLEPLQPLLPDLPPFDIAEEVDLDQLVGVGGGNEYLTNDLTTLFFEQFPGGSGEYQIVLFDRQQVYDIRVLKTSEDDYFSFQLMEPLEDGWYGILVRDVRDPQSTRQMLLEVKRREPIAAPLIMVVDEVQQLRPVVSDERFIVRDPQPVLSGRTPLSATLAIYSENLDETFIVYTDENDEFEFVYPDKLVAGFADRLNIIAHYENGHVSQETTVILEYQEPQMLYGSAPVEMVPFNALFWAFVSTLTLLTTALLLFLLSITGQILRSHQMMLTLPFFPTQGLKRFLSVILSLLLAVALIAMMTIHAFAATTTPNLIPFEGVLKTPGGVPITVPQSFRFSFWLDGDFTGGVDRDGAGAIPGAAPGFSGFSEVHTVTPDATGFFSLDIGSVGGSIPDFIITSELFIQVEIKPSASPDTAYETLDPDGVDNATDRQAIGTLPYARNADFIDNAELGTSTGDIVALGAGDVFPVSVIPGAINGDDFIIDDNDDAPGNTRLSFGALLNNRILEFDPDGVAAADGWFNFTDDVNITGNLTVTGTINGVTLGAQNKSLQFQPEYPNSTYDGDGVANRGKLQVFYVDTDGAGGPDNFNYYRWTTRQVTLQDFDLVARVRLPDDFTSFQATPMVLRYRTSNGVVTDNRVDVSVEDSTGTVVPGLAGNSALVNAGSFTTTNITFGGGTFTAGTEITIIIKLSTLNTAFADVSDLTLNYVGN